MSDWIRTKLFGIRLILNAAGDALPERSTVQFIGLTAEDDPVNKRTIVTSEEQEILNDATTLATPDTLVLRGASAEAHFAGTCTFEIISCDEFTSSGQIESGANIVAQTTISGNALVAATSVTCASVAASGTVACNALTSTTSIACATATASTSITSPFHASTDAGSWKSSNKTANSTHSGAASYGSGDVSGTTSNSGALTAKSGTATGTTGSVAIGSGNSSAGSSGAVTISTGTATGENGNIELKIGTGGSSGGNVSLGAQSPTYGAGRLVVHIPLAVTPPLMAPTTGSLLYVDPEDDTLKTWTAGEAAPLNLVYRAPEADIGALTDNTAGTANNTLEALPNPADAPATADALRDDLVANLIPALRNNYADLAEKCNALRTALRNHGIMA